MECKETILPFAMVWNVPRFSCHFWATVLKRFALSYRTTVYLSCLSVPAHVVQCVRHSDAMCSRA